DLLAPRGLSRLHRRPLLAPTPLRGSAGLRCPAPRNDLRGALLHLPGRLGCLQPTCVGPAVFRHRRGANQRAGPPQGRRTPGPAPPARAVPGGTADPCSPAGHPTDEHHSPRRRQDGRVPTPRCGPGKPRLASCAQRAWRSTAMTQTVLITGSSSGIGRATAQLFAQRGWNVAATARNPAALAPLAHANLLTLPLDVTEEASIAAAVAATTARFGSLDVLVNNAGYGLFGPLEGTTAEQLEAQFRTNVFGVVAMIQQVVPLMRQRHSGTIVTISSTGGRVASPFASAYHASKFALEGLCESLRFELKPQGIRVKLVEPGHVKTGFMRSLTVVGPEGPALQGWG